MAPDIGFTHTKENGNFTIRFRVRDSYAIVSSATYVIDGGEIQKALPLDGLFDSDEEVFELTFKDIGDVEHSLVFYAEDSAGNRASSQLTFSKDE